MFGWTPQQVRDLPLDDAAMLADAINRHDKSPQSGGGIRTVADLKKAVFE